MKYIILAIVFAVALARPQDAPPASAPAEGGAAAAPAEHKNVTILSSTSENDGMGKFRWSFETSDGQKAEQEGHTVAPAGDSTDGPIQVIQGSYSYQGPDGKTYQITYIADQNGFQPKGDFLPTPPADPNAPAAGAASSAPPPAPSA